MPPRRRGRFENDPYYSVYRQTAWKGDRIRPGYLEHRDLLSPYETIMDLDERDRLQFWADYNRYMVSDRSPFRRNDPDNPFWQTWGIDPDDFDWDGWREAMGYEHGNRRR